DLIRTWVDYLNTKLEKLAIAPHLWLFVAPAALEVPELLVLVATGFEVLICHQLHGCRAFRAQTEFTTALVFKGIHLAKYFRPGLICIHACRFHAWKDNFFVASRFGEFNHAIQ